MVLQVLKACLDGPVKDDVTVVGLTVPKQVVEDFGVSLIRSYVERLYEVVSFRVSFDPKNFDRKIKFCVKGHTFDALRFSYFLFSL